MDVDLLRPGTVPISKDTMLWFEFLLNPKLLNRHLANPNGDPTPTDLIMKFLTMSISENKSGVDPEVITNGTKMKQSLRSQGLKIIALKVAAFLKWDLDILESKLPLDMQLMLLRDLLNLVSEDLNDPVNHENLDFSSLSPHLFFAVQLYHRWIVRSYVKSTAMNRHMKVIPLVEGATPGINNPAESPPSKEESKISATILERIIRMKNLPRLIMPSFESLVPLSEDIIQVEHQWDVGQLVPESHFRCQICMEVAEYYMYLQSYVVSRNAIEICKEAFIEAGGARVLPKMADPLAGMCTALGLSPPPPARGPPNLTLQFLNAIANLDMGKLLDKDNMLKEIPMLFRDCFELDVCSEVASGKVTAQRDSVMMIQASNLVRRAMERQPWHKTKITPTALNKAVLGVLGSANELEKKRLELFLLELLATYDTAFVRELRQMDCIKLLLREDQVSSVLESDYANSIPSVLLDPESDTPSMNPNCVVPSIERQVISSYDPHDIKEAINKLWQVKPSLAIEKINRSWEVPIPIYNMIMLLPNSIRQNYIYVLLCKAYQLDEMKSYGFARTMLRMVIEELSKEPGVHAKLTQLVNWELLLIDIHQFHSEWPSKHMDWMSLSEECKKVVETIGEGLLPRVSLREDCCLTLLNMGHWHQLTSTPSQKLLPQTSQLYITLANVCLDVKFSKKPSLELWDKVLSTVNIKGRAENPCQFQASLCRVVDVTALTVVSSLLARIHNILIDQPSCELYLHLIQLWPNTIKNSSHYNLKWIAEMLWEVVNHAVKLYPNNMTWSKLLGDLHYASGHYASALKCFLEAAIAGSDYFARPVTKTVLEDHVVRKMIKCCINLQCHSQAAILCQFLEDVDYTTAFKSLQEQSSWDAMDSYYDCIWDVTILEYLINLHSRRNEHYRKQRAIVLMGLLELNSNNNDEIKREAENIRKAKFLRAMAKHYIC